MRILRSLQGLFFLNVFLNSSSRWSRYDTQLKWYMLLLWISSSNQDFKPFLLFFIYENVMMEVIKLEKYYVTSQVVRQDLVANFL